jgi:hypothetical protein
MTCRLEAAALPVPEHEQHATSVVAGLCEAAALARHAESCIHCQDAGPELCFAATHMVRALEAATMSV